MVTHYGSTGTEHSLEPPPPTRGLPHPNDGSPVDQSRPLFGRIPKEMITWTKRVFVVIVVLIVTAGLFMYAMPAGYCNSPLDSRVPEREREKWSKELLEHQRQEAQRESRWAQEDEEHAALLREWEQERTQHKLDLEERARREEEEHWRLNLYWGRVEAHQCKSYGTREYTAVLMNLPADWGHRRVIDACRVTPLEVHGIRLVPKSCVDKGNGVVTGQWEIDQFEPDCKPMWIWYKDKETKGSGKRLIEQYLENIPRGGDWREFCTTTPARFDGMEFTGAQKCIPINNGAWGYWEIDDTDC